MLKKLLNLTLAVLVVFGTLGPAPFLAVIAHAATPDTISYQGRLRDELGVAVADGDYDFTFTLFDAAEVGVEDWTEAQTVAVTDGYFSVQLGSVDPFNDGLGEETDLNSARWLEVQVVNDADEVETLEPRVAINSVAYAMTSRAIESLAVAPAVDDSYGGRMYFDTTDGELYVFVEGAPGAWVSTTDTGPDTNLGTDDLALTGNRTLTMDGFSLTLDGDDDVIFDANGDTRFGGGFEEEGDGGITAFGNGFLSIDGNLVVDGDSDLTLTEIGGGYTDTGTTLFANGDISSAGNLIVDGTSTLTGDLTVSGAVVLPEGSVDSAEILDGSIVDADLAGGAYASITTVGNLTDLTVDGTLGVAGNTSLSTLEVSGVADLLDALNVGGGSGGSGSTLGTDGSATFDGLLSANGGITVDGGVFTVADETGSVSTDGDLNVGTNASIAGTLDVEGLLSSNGGVSLGDQALTGTTGTVGYTNWNVAANGNISTTGELSVDGQSVLDGVVSVGDGYGFTGITLSSGGNIQANGSLTVDGDATMLSADFGGGYGSGGATIAADGSGSFEGIIAGAGGLDVDGGDIYLNNNSLFNTNINTGASAGSVTIGGTAGNVIDIGTDDSIADTIGIGSSLDALTISSSGLNVASTGAITGALTVQVGGGYNDILDGGATFGDEGDISANGTLTIGSTSSFGGLLSADGGITVDAGAFTVTDATGDVHTDGTLEVDGLSTLTGGITADDGISNTALTWGILESGDAYFENVDLGGGFAGGGSTFSSTGAISIAGALTADGGITADGGVFTIADATGAIHTGSTLDVDGGANIADTTAGSDVTMGNSTGNLSFLSDNVDFTLTDGADGVFKLTNPGTTRDFISVDTGVAEKITIGNTLDQTVINGGSVNISTSAQSTISIGNASGTTSIGFTSGTGAQTFTSSYASGGAGAAFILNDTALTSGTLLSADLRGTSGTGVNFAYGGVVAQAGSVTGLSVNLGNLTGADGFNATGLNMVLNGQTFSGSGTENLTGLNILSDAALVQETLAGTVNWAGIKTTVPATTQTTGVVNASGSISILPSGNTSGTVNGFQVTTVATGPGAGTMNGLLIGNVTTPGAGTENAIKIGAGWDSQISGTGWSVNATGFATFGGGLSIGGSETGFADADTTPSVLGGSNFRYANVGGATTITDFDDGVTGQVIFVRAGITDDILDCTANANFVCGTGDITIGSNDSTVWYLNDAGSWVLVSMMDSSDNQGAGNGFDYAEYFPSHAELSPGDVVTVDATGVEFVKKSEQAYDRAAVGVVSTQPGMVIGEPTVAYAAQIALAGRVPVNVTDENGAVEPGDYLTTSSTPGFAMKATEAGAVIGVALESFAGTSGQVKMKVANFWYAPPTSVASSLQGSDGSVLSSGSISADTVIVAEHLVGSSDMAGRAHIVAGDTRVHVDFEEEYAYQPIVNATLRSNVNIEGYWWIEEESSTGFDIVLDGTLGSDVEFNWIAVGVDGGEVSVSDGSTREIELYVLDGSAPTASDEEVVVVADEPAADETPVVEETPVVIEEPVVEETPVVEEAPAEETPVADEPVVEPTVE